jgi:hypothetical protein
VHGLPNVIHRTPILVLACLLFVQLSGLTCIQDASASVFGESGDAAVAAIGSPESLPGSGDGPESSLEHDCPCHHLMSLPTGVIESVESPEAPIAPVSLAVPADRPQILFHPPLALL